MDFPPAALKIRQLGPESDYSPHSVKITNEWSCTFSPTFVYMLSK
jgi:hypothetical protein